MSAAASREARMAMAQRLLQSGARIELDPATGGYAVRRSQDRRRRAAVRLSAAEGEALLGRATAPDASTCARPRPARLEFLRREEAEALQRFEADVEAGEGALLRGLDWSRARGAKAACPQHQPPGGAARARVRQVEAALAPALFEILLAQAGGGLEALSRKRHWPARSWRLALSLACAQLAQHYRFAAPSPD